MHLSKTKPRFSTLFRATALGVVLAFISSLITPVPGYAQSPVSVLNLPAPGTMVQPTPAFNPSILKGMTVHPDDPFLFDFIVHPGDENLQGEALKDESMKFIKYFMAALTVPEDGMWVNLSPYEKDRIVPAAFGDTEMGRDLLAQDYMLKQLTASLTYPENELGSEFWKRARQRAYEKYGTTEVPMDTFNKVWIVPDKASIYQNGMSVFVVESHLKVMLEDDYLALEANAGSTKHGLSDIKPDELKKLNAVSSEVIREIIIPELEKEVNEGKTFANLRQISNAVILATWYKQNVQGSILEQMYINKKQTKGVDTQDKGINRKIYDQYIAALKQGVYGFIKEDYDPAQQSSIPRKYFSGGAEIDWQGRIADSKDNAQLGEDLKGSSRVRMRMKNTAGDQAMVSSPITNQVHAILPEQSAYYLLSERSYTTSEDNYTTRRPVEREKAIEHSSQSVEETRRYSEFFGDLNRWPRSSLAKEKILARWIDKLVPLQGKRVVQYRPEYYPFFGIETAQLGAITHLVNASEAPFVEDFLLGKRRISFQDYRTATSATRQISPLSDAVTEYAEELMKLPPQLLMEIIVREKNNFSEAVWEGLSDLEKKYYIIVWIKDNPGLGLEAARYFSQEVHSESGGSQWWSLNEEERLPYLIEFFTENLSQILRKEVQTAALSILRRKGPQSITGDQQFALYIGEIYGQNGLLEGNDVLSEEGLQDKTAAQNLRFQNGQELEDVDIPESSVDVVFTGLGLNFIENSVKFSNGLQRLLRPGGLFVGYLNIRESGVRGFTSVASLNEALNRLGFSDENILIVEEEENGRVGHDLQLLFFAKKNENAPTAPPAASSQQALPFVAGDSQALVKAGSSLSLRGSGEIPVSNEFEPIEKNWREDQTLSSLSQQIMDLSRSEMANAEAILRSLCAFVFSAGKEMPESTIEKLLGNQTNIENLIRHLTLRFKEFSDLEEAVGSDPQFSGLNQILSRLKEFYLKRKQISYLLNEITDFLKRINLFLPTDELQKNVLARVEAVGNSELREAVGNILNAVNRPGIPWRARQAMVNEAQVRLANYLHNYNYFILVEFAVSPIFYSRGAHPEGPPENTAYEVKASTGEVVEVSQVKINGQSYSVEKVNRNISTYREVRGEFVDFGDNQKHYVVYVDSYRDWFETIKGKYRRRGVWGALLKRQWGDAHPSDEEILMSEVESIAIHEIIHDLFPRLGEAPSYLTQIAYGPQPFVDLFHRVLSLLELKEGGAILELIRLGNPEARSEHYQASAAIIAHYLKYALDHDKVAPAQLRGLVGSILVSGPGGIVLDELRVYENRDAIIAALSLLSENEIRTIAKDWLKEQFSFELPELPVEVTLSLPVPDELLGAVSDARASLPALENRRIVQSTVESLGEETSLSVTATGESLVQVLRPALENSLAVSDPMRRSNAVSQLAILAASWNVDGAVNLIRNSIRQNFPRAKALVHLAMSLEAVGNTEKASELLREAEAILVESDRRVQAYLPDESSANFGHFLSREILMLKRRLGLTVEAVTDDVLTAQLEEIEVDELPMEVYKSLIEEAVLRGDRRLLTQIEKSISRKNDWKGWQAERVLELKILIGLAEYKLGNTDKAHEMIGKVASEDIVMGTANVQLRAAVALAHVGFPGEALEKIRDLQAKHPRNLMSEDQLYTTTGEIKAISGDIDGAGRDFQRVLDFLNGKEYADLEWRAMNLLSALHGNPDLLDIALQIMSMIRDYERRADAFLRLILRAYEAGGVQQSDEMLSVALRITENIEDNTRRELMRFRIITVGQKMKNNEKIGRAFDSLYLRGESFMPEWFFEDVAMSDDSGRGPSDSALLGVSDSNFGGIDVNPQNIEFSSLGESIKMQTLVDLQNIQLVPVNLTPNFINISPITNIPLLLGENTKKPESWDAAGLN